MDRYDNTAVKLIQTTSAVIIYIVYLNFKYTFERQKLKFFPHLLQITNISLFN